MQQTNKPRAGVLSSLPVMGMSNPMAGSAGQSPGWVAIEGLKKSFEIEQVPATALEVSDELNLLIVIHPKDLSDKTQYAIDQYIMRGGKVMLFVDPFSRADLAMSSQAQMMGRMPSASSNVAKLFEAWGLKYNSQEIAGDLSTMMRVNAGGQLVSYPYFFTVSGEGISKSTVVSGNLNEILLAEPGKFEFDQSKGLSFEPIIQTSEQSGTANGMMAAYMNPADFSRQLKESKGKIAVAGFVKGGFKSAFTEAPSYDKEEQAPSTPYIAESKSDQVVFVMADVDFMSDGNSVDQMRFAGQIITRLKNDNLNLVFNTADFLGGNDALINIRSSGRISRPFTRVQDIQARAQKKWKAEEEKLSSQLSGLQKKLNELQKQRTDGNILSMSADQQVEIKKFRAEERDVRKKRREVRRNLREDIEDLGFRLKLANLLVVPLLVIGLGVFVFISRQNRMLGGK